ncbi:MAG: FAD-dependent oxidoreductase, partial [Clostridia bacterium]|nr:FAD-dependent oxidoreductase [Clostridia bacterium]
TRVMPNCFSTGEAAGIAAALAVKKACGVHALDAKEILSYLHPAEDSEVFSPSKT